MPQHDPPHTQRLAPSKQDIVIFANHCVFARAIYLHLKALFETSSADDRALMGRAAGIFFRDLSRVLIEYVVLLVCKITDPAQDSRNNDNHTIAFLLQHDELNRDPLTLKRLHELRDQLQAFGAKLRRARDKLISHSDRVSILAVRPPGAATDQEWNQFWLDLQEFLNIVHRKAAGDSTFDLNAVAALSDANGLLTALQRSAYFDQVLSDPALTTRLPTLWPKSPA